MRSLPFLLLLLLIGCSSSPPQTAGEAACRQQAYQDPTVKEAIIQKNTGANNMIFDKSLQDSHELAREAIQQATTECLRKRGLPTPGGVEPVKQYPFSPLAF